MSIHDSRPNMGNRGFLSGESNDEGLFPVHGVAIGNNDVTVGHLSGEKKLWIPEVLEEAADTLEGKKIVVDHENDSARQVIGKVTDSKFDENRGVIYQGVIDDEELARKVDNGWLEVSPRIIHSSDMEEREGVKIPRSIRKFDNLSVVSYGASKSNEIELGKHEELSQEELKAAFETDEEFVSDWEYPADEDIGEDEELQEDFDFSQWMYESPQGAQGANEKFPCDGIHEHEVEGKTWYMPCSTHDAFLSALEEMDEDELEVDEMQLSEARRPDYDGIEEKSWGDIPADTLSYYIDNLDFDAESWDDLSQEQKNEIASHTLLGDSDADTADDGIFFPVVNASTSNLNRGALEAVRSGRGQSADIPDSAYESAFREAGRLLNEEFDADVETDFDEMSESGEPDEDGVEAEEMQTEQEEKRRLAGQVSSFAPLTRDEVLLLLNTLDTNTPEDPESLILLMERVFGISRDNAENVLSRAGVDIGRDGAGEDSPLNKIFK